MRFLVGSKEITSILEERYLLNSIATEWSKFIEDITHRNRYFPDESIFYILEKLKIFHVMLPKHTLLYRARLLNFENKKQVVVNATTDASSSKIKGLKADEMGAPPKELATSGRANPFGISYLYLANNPEIACSEVQPIWGDWISVSTFKTFEDLGIIDLTNIYEDNKLNRYEQLLFETLREAFSTPVRNKDKDYLATQYIAAYLESKNYQGIKYPSAQNSSSKEGYNVVLFNESSAKCLDDFGKVYCCIEKKLSFEVIERINQ